MTDAFGGRGGIAQYNRDFLTGVAECATVSSIIVVPRHAPDRAMTPVRIRQLSPEPGKIRYTLTALRVALFERVDVVFCGHLYMAHVAALIAGIKHAKLIIQTHGTDAWLRPSPVLRAAVKAADLVLCVSYYTRDRVLAWAAIAPERAMVLPNTVADIFEPGDSTAMREELQLNGKQVLLTVGRMDSREQYKGHDRVIGALPALIAKSYDPIYLVVGEGDDRPRLEALARRAGLATRVRFLGTVGQQRLVELYRMADLFVMPSMGEGFGIVFLEAMASGTPALGLDIAGASDALGGLGALISDEELPDAIDRILSGPKQCPRELAESVRAKFGRAAFESRVRAALEKLSIGE